VILQALCDYYDILARAGEISKPGYAPTKVSFALVLEEDGALAGVVPQKYQVLRGKKSYDAPKEFQLPAPVKRAVNIAPNFLYDNASYVLGADLKGKPERARQCFEAFRQLHHTLLDDVDAPGARALLAFLDGWNPAQAQSCEALREQWEQLLAGGNIVFQLRGGAFLHEEPALLAAWDGRGEAGAGPLLPCLVSGTLAPTAKLHPSLKGIKGGQPTGSSLVSFNANAYESYGRVDAQGLNAPVSERAAFAYTTALNHLLSKNKLHLGDATVIYWAESPGTAYAEVFEAFVAPQAPDESAELEEDREAQNELRNMLSRAAAGEPIHFSYRLDPAVRFHILGLSPNAARAAVRFYHTDSFGAILKNLGRHFHDLEIAHGEKEFEFLPLWALLSETVSPNAREKASSPLLTGAVLRAILMGAPYPRALFCAVMTRVKAERNINRGKAAIIKAYLLRSENFQHKEACTVALNKESNHQAYVLGRLFSVLEKAQKDALPGITATIKDRYFTSACAAPRTTFPVLLKLAQHHMRKAEYGGVSERRIQELLGKLDVERNPFPAQLSLEEQGLFVLGYYHQAPENYQTREKEGA
jgi:CRISPR-associated protein Csd1